MVMTLIVVNGGDDGHDGDVGTAGYRLRCLALVQSLEVQLVRVETVEQVKHNTSADAATLLSCLRFIAYPNKHSSVLRGSNRLFGLQARIVYTHRRKFTATATLRAYGNPSNPGTRLCFWFLTHPPIHPSLLASRPSWRPFSCLWSFFGHSCVLLNYPPPLFLAPVDKDRTEYTPAPPSLCHTRANRLKDSCGRRRRSRTSR